MLQGTLNIEKLTIEEGELNLIIYPDSTTNILRATRPESSEDDTSGAEIFLNNVSIKNLTVQYKNNLGQSEVQFKINKLNNNFFIYQNVITIINNINCII